MKLLGCHFDTLVNGLKRLAIKAERLQFSQNQVTIDSSEKVTAVITRDYEILGWKVTAVIPRDYEILGWCPAGPGLPRGEKVPL